MATASNTKPSKTRREIEGLSEKIKDTRLTVKDLAIPISVLLILLLLVIFVFIPMVKTAISFREEYKSTIERREQLETAEKKLKEIEEAATLQTDLINAKKVIPQTLRVASFMSYIDNLAREKQLSSDALTAGDSQTSVIRKGEGEGERRVYFGVSSPLNYEGELSNVLTFLDTLYEASPYVISVSGVELRRGAGDKWTVELNVMGYYVPESSMETNIYKNFVSYLEYQDVVDTFSQKAAQLP